MTKKSKIDEDPRKRFVRLANARYARAVRAIASLRHLADRRRYTYNPRDVEVLFDSLASEVGRTRSAFTSRDKSACDAILTE